MKKAEITGQNMGFDEALSRFAKTKPSEVAESIAHEVSERIKATEKRINDAQEEIKRGARTKKGRFSL